MFNAGPDVSLNGSPTVSPTTTAACWSVPLPPWCPASTYFLALSQAPPAFAIMMARRKPVAMAPISSPPSASAPRTAPTAAGATMAINPGNTISRMAPRVLISTARA